MTHSTFSREVSVLITTKSSCNMLQPLLGLQSLWPQANLMRSAVAAYMLSHAEMLPK